MQPAVRTKRKQRVRVPRLYTPQPAPPRDQHGIHQAACYELADELGYRADGIWWWWKQIAGAVEMNTGYPRAVCEHYALDCVRAAFDKRGCVAD